MLIVAADAAQQTGAPVGVGRRRIDLADGVKAVERVERARLDQFVIGDAGRGAGEIRVDLDLAAKAERVGRIYVENAVVVGDRMGDRLLLLHVVGRQRLEIEAAHVEIAAVALPRQIGRRGRLAEEIIVVQADVALVILQESSGPTGPSRPSRISTHR